MYLPSTQSTPMAPTQRHPSQNDSFLSSYPNLVDWNIMQEERDQNEQSYNNYSSKSLPENIHEDKQFDRQSNYSHQNVSILTQKDKVELNLCLVRLTSCSKNTAVNVYHI